MRTPISVPPEEDQELWARFEARRQKERRKKRAAVICAGAVLAAILAAFGWYSRPRSWTELAGEGAAVCMAGMSVPDNNWDAGTALEKLDYEIWSLREADGEINRAFLEVLERFRFRKRLESLTAGDGVSLGGSGYVMVAVTAGEEADFFYFAENGRVVASAAGHGYGIYSSDPALRDALAQVVRAYGTLQE